MNQDFTFRVMNLFNNNNLKRSLFWNTNEADSSISFFVYSHMAHPEFECEDITEKNIAVLEQAFKDVTNAYTYGADYALDLFCCRTRKVTTPHQYWIKLPKELQPIFITGLLFVLGLIG